MGEQMNYQLEAKNEKLINPAEKRVLDDINTFLKRKNYEDGKKILNDPNTDIGKKYLSIASKVQEMKTQTKTESTRTIEVQNTSPSPQIKSDKSTETRTEDTQLDNMGQEKGKVELIDQDQLNQIVPKIKENLNNPNYSVSVIGRSDANKFVAGPTANKLIASYNALTKDLRSDLPETIKTTLTAPIKPEKATEQQLSDWLNTVLAQARALQTLQLLKKNLGTETFVNLMKKSNTSVNIEPHNPTLEGEDRGASIVCKMQEKLPGSNISQTPKSKEVFKEREHFEYYTAIKFEYPDGKSIYKMFKKSANIKYAQGKEPELIVPASNWTPINATKNLDGTTIPKDITTLKYKNIAAPNMEELSKKDKTQSNKALEKTTTTYADGSKIVSEEYTTSVPTKIVLQPINYPLKNGDVKTYGEGETMQKILNENYDIKKLVKRQIQKPSFNS